MWQMIFVFSLVLFAAAIFCVVFQTRKIFKKHAWLFAAVFVAAAFFVLVVFIGFVGSVIALMHLAFFFLLVSLLRRFFKRLPIAAAPILTLAYLAFGWYCAHHVWRTEYLIQSEKIQEKIKIVQITDSHIGATFDAKGFARHAERIAAENADLIVITGDFVDDDSKRADMEQCVAALEKIRPKYGIFFCYGNHDAGYFDRRDFSDADLRATFAKSQIKILEDEIAELPCGVLVAGRKDSSISPDRISARDLLSDADKEKFILLLDHEPNDFSAEAKSGADLVLCGHTHGGQMIPIGFISEKILRTNDRTYGIEVRGNTTFIVSSGISDWAIPFKTGTGSEYVVIEIIATSPSFK